MATQNLYASSHVTGTFLNPNNALGNTPTTWAGELNVNSNYASRWAMADPAAALTGTQTIRVFAKKGSNSGTPTISIELWQNSVLVSTILAATNITSTTGQTLTATFDASAVGSGANVEIEVTHISAGGSPNARNSAQISHIEWTASIIDPPIAVSAADSLALASNIEPISTSGYNVFLSTQESETISFVESASRVITSDSKTSSDTTSLSISDATEPLNITEPPLPVGYDMGYDQDYEGISSATAEPVLKTGSDSVTASVSESIQFSIISVVASDSLSTSMSDTASYAIGGEVNKAGSDTLGASMTDLSAISFITLVSNESATVTITEGSSGFISRPASDLTNISVEDSGAVVISGTVIKTAPDSSTITVTESVAEQAFLVVSDTLATSVADSSDIVVGGSISKSATDLGTLSVADSSAILFKSINSTDSTSVSIVESQTTDTFLSSSDSLSVPIDDASSNSVGGLIIKSAADESAINVVEGSSPEGITISSDALGMSILESADVVVGGAITISGGDSLVLAIDEHPFDQYLEWVVSESETVSLDEAYLLNVNVDSTDDLSIGSADTYQIGVSHESTDDLSAQIVDSSSVEAGGLVEKTTTDTATLSVTDTSAIFVTLDRPDQTVISLSDSVSLDTASASADSISLSISDVAVLEIGGTIEKAANDTSTIGIIDVSSTPSVALASNDATTVAISEGSDGFVTRLGSDTADLSVIDASVVEISGLVIKSSSDSAGISIAETQSRFISLSRTDVSTLSITDASSGFVSRQATDAGSLQITDSSSTLVSGSVAKSGSDSGTLSVADNSIISEKHLSDTDAADVSVVDAGVLFASATSDDTVSLGVVEDGALEISGLVEKTSADSVILSSEDTVGSTFVEAVAFESATVTVTEGSSGGTWIIASDNGALSVADTAEVVISGNISKDSADADVLSLAETTSTFVYVDRGDTLSTNIADSSQTQADTDSADSALVGVTESTEYVVSGLVEKNDSDLVGLSVSEGASTFVTAAPGDALGLSLTEGYSLQLSVQATDDLTVGVTGATDVDVSGNISKSATDSLETAITETSSRAISLARFDTASLSVVESVETVINSESNDGLGLNVSEAHLVQTALASTDVIALSALDSSDTFVYINGSDATTVYITEGSTGFIERVSSDTASVSIIDSSSIVISGQFFKSASDQLSATLLDAAALNTNSASVDSIALGIAESTQTVAYGTVTIVGSDTGTLGLIEQTGLANTLSGTETTSLVLAESTDLVISGTIVKGAGDQTDISVVDISATAGFISRADYLSATISDQSVRQTDNANDALGLEVFDSAAVAAQTSDSDSTVLGIIDTASVNVSVLVSDALEVAISGLTDKSLTGTVLVSAYDSLTLWVNEQTFVRGRVFASGVYFDTSTNNRRRFNTKTKPNTSVRSSSQPIFKIT